jgi:hypothetical protein
MPGQAQLHGAARIACAGLAPHPRQDGRPSGEELKICSTRAAEDDPGTGDRHWVTHINKEPRAGLQATELRRAVPIGGPGRGRAPIDRHGCGLGIVARARAGRPERRGTDRGKHLDRGCRCPGFRRCRNRRGGLGGPVRSRSGCDRLASSRWVCAKTGVEEGNVSDRQRRPCQHHSDNPARSAGRLGAFGARWLDRRQRVNRYGVACFCHGRVYSWVGGLGELPVSGTNATAAGEDE